jgi:hypothetical protein
MPFLELPEDNRGHPVHALSFGGAAHQIELTGAAPTARNATAFADGTKVIRIYHHGPVFFKLGDDTVTADNTDHYYLGNFQGPMDIFVKDATHISFHCEVVETGGTTTVYVSEIG